MTRSTGVALWLFLGSLLVLWYLNEALQYGDLFDPRSMWWGDRVAAAVFLFAVILWTTIEFGWGGGDKNK